MAACPNQLENYGTMLEVFKPQDADSFPPENNLNSNSLFVPTDLGLPVRLGRLSKKQRRDRRITMILHPGAKEEPVFYAISRFTALQPAIENLQKREGCPTSRYIGFVDLKTNQSKSQIQDVATKVKEWAQRRGFDAVIWTDLPSKGVVFGENSNGEEILPLLDRDPTLLENTKRYIRNLAQVRTPLMDRILKMNEPLPVLPTSKFSFSRILSGIAIVLSVSIVFLAARKFFRLLRGA